MIVDGKTAYVGGHNVGDEYLGKDPKIGAWRDTHVKVSGPWCSAYRSRGWRIGAGPRGPPHAKLEAEAAPGGRTALPSACPGPADPFETCTLFFLHAINSAKKRVWIASPYFVPDEQFISALQLASLRGVDVRILVPEHADS